MESGTELPLGIGPSAAALPWPPDLQVEERRRRERTCRRGPHLGAPPRQRTPCLSTARESNPALLLGRQGPQPLGQRYESKIEIEGERAPRLELSGTSRRSRDAAKWPLGNSVPSLQARACSRKHLARFEAKVGIGPTRTGVAIRRLPIWLLGRVEETARIE